MLNERSGDLMTFLAIVDAGSFVGGGKAVGITRSGASKAMGRLEDRLGVRLLHRTTRAISLTDEGRTFYERALTVASALHDAEASVTTPMGTPRGVLRLTAPDTFGRRVVLPLIGEFLAEWPEVQAEVSFSDHPSDLVEENFDLAFRIDAAASDARFVSRVVARYQRVLVASPGYLRERGEPDVLDDLIDHDALLFVSRGRRQTWWLGMAGVALRKVRVNGRLRLDNGEALRDAAVAGHGIALLPMFLVTEELESGVLRQVLPKAIAASVEVTALYPSKRLLVSRVRLFLDLIVGERRPASADCVGSGKGARHDQRCQGGETDGAAANARETVREGHVIITPRASLGLRRPE